MFYKRKGKLIPCSNSLNGGYKRAYLRGKRFEQHRLAYYIMTGHWPNIIDHINNDKSDNRWVNLRNSNHSLNGYNRSDKTSGVIFCKTRNKWRVTDCNNHLGYFDEFEEALNCKNKFRQKVFECAD